MAKSRDGSSRALGIAFEDGYRFEPRYGEGGAVTACPAEDVCQGLTVALGRSARP